MSTTGIRTSRMTIWVFALPDSFIKTQSPLKKEGFVVKNKDGENFQR